MMTTRSLLALAGLMTVAPGIVRAQERVHIAITPRVSLWAPTRGMGPAAPAEGPWYLHLGKVEPSLALGLSAQASWPGSHVQTRLTGLHARPGAVSGQFLCGPGQVCPSVLIPIEADVSVLAAVADVILSPVSGDHMRPYAALGAGIKRYAFSWPAAPVFLSAAEHAETSFALHAGLGVDVVVGGHRFHAELADFWSGHGPVVATDPQGARAGGPRRRTQHDIGLSLGWQMLRF